LVNSGEILTYRHHSTEGFSLVVLDPEWLIKAFTSIVSIQERGSNFRRGMITRESLETTWRNLEISEDTWPQLERLFQLFQMMVKLPNGGYFVPLMLHSKRSTKTISVGPEEVSCEEFFFIGCQKKEPALEE
jgi:hypothetical protein